MINLENFKITDLKAGTFYNRIVYSGFSVFDANDYVVYEHKQVWYTIDLFLEGEMICY